MARRSARVAVAEAQNLRGSSSQDSANEVDVPIEVGASHLKRPRSTTKRLVKKRKTSQQGTDQPGDADEEVDPESGVCDLYQAIVDPETSLQTLVSDFLDSYKEEPAESMTQLVQMILNACGTKQTVTSFDIEDVETVPETLMQLQEHLTGTDRSKVRLTADSYPLVSREKKFKVFRKQLCDFVQTLVSQCRDRKLLFDQESELMQVFETWTVSMSSSTLRAFRHTSTAICLATITALVDCHAILLREIATLQKQQTTLQKTSGQKGNAKLAANKKGLQAKDSALLEVKTMINNYFDSVFVHRYRDTDGKIRSECIRELGLWMQRLPSVFFQGAYLRYLGWILSDVNAATRLEVVRTLSKLYGIEEFTANLRHFTSKFKDRILAMALSDADIAVRCATLQTTDRMRQRGLLEDEDLESLVSCVVDSEPRIRDATRPLLQGILQERSEALIDDALGGDAGSDAAVVVPFKVMASTLLRICGTAKKNHASSAIAQLPLLPLNTAASSAATIAIKGLAGFDFQALSDYILKEESIDEKQNSLLQLTSAEEGVLLEVLLAVAETSLAHGKTEDEENLDILRGAIVSSVGDLLQRHTDASKVNSIARLCLLVDGTAFADARAQAAFESQLASLARFFMTYGEPFLLHSVGQVLLHFSSQESLARFVEDLIMDLMHEVREALLARDSGVSLEPLLLRMSILSGLHDCVTLFERPEAVFDVIRRASSTFNAPIANAARICLRNYFMWKVKAARNDSVLREEVCELRDRLINLYKEQIGAGQLDVAPNLVELETIFAICEESNVASADCGEAAKAVAQSFIKATKRFGSMVGTKDTADVETLAHALSLDLDDNFSDDEAEDEEELPVDEGSARDDVLIKLEADICAMAGLIIRAVTMKQMDAAFASLLTANKGKLGSSFDRMLKELPVS